MADESFYVDGDLSGSGEFVEGQTSLGVVCTVPNGTFKAIRVRYPAVAPLGPVLARLYPGAGGPALASVNAFDTTSLDAWNIATFAMNYSAAAGTYRPTVVTPNRYVALGGFFAAGTITRGNLTFGSSRFDSGDVFPTQSSTATYFVDVVFEVAATSVAGTLTVALPAFTSAMAGGLTITGTTAATLASAILAAAGGERVGGALAASLPAFVSAFAQEVPPVGAQPPITSQTRSGLYISQTSGGKL